MKVQINQWVPVAVWKWNNISPNDDVCGICRSHFEDTCPTCPRPGPECPPVSGECSHSFHKHCIQKWLQRDGDDRSCPMCRRPFSAEGVGNDTATWSDDDPMHSQRSIESENEEDSFIVEN